MLTGWQTIPLHLGDRQFSEIDAKLALREGPRGWMVDALVIEDIDTKEPIRIERDGTVRRGNQTECSLMGPALICQADHYFSLNESELVAEFIEARDEPQWEKPIYGVGFRNGRYAA
jgi:hypothetical protein